MTARLRVVITAYNKGRALIEAARSVQAQTFGAFEAVIVDDCSTDDTADIAAEIVASGDARFSVRRPPSNLGASGARNYGATDFTGEFLAFLDGDDTYRPQFLEKCLAQFERLPMIDVVQTGIALPPEVPEALHGPIRNTAPTNRVMKRHVFSFLGGFPEYEALRQGGEDAIMTRLVTTVFNQVEITENLYTYDCLDSPHYQRMAARVVTRPDGAVDWLPSEDGLTEFIEHVWQWQKACLKEKLRALVLRHEGAQAALPEITREDLTSLQPPEILMLRGARTGPGAAS